MKTIAILGSTGSIGASALDVVRRLGPRFRVVGLTARSRWKELHGQIAEFHPETVAVEDPAGYDRLKAEVNGSGTLVLPGAEGVRDVAAADGVDVVLSAITGAAGLEPGLAALRRGRTLALANKESLVTAGPLMIETARAAGAQIVPVDSEHSAIFQCLVSGRREEVRRVCITASGGPFRAATIEEMRAATREQALKHPTWSMGAKITIDSATMMNKALEVIEARWLFDLDPGSIDVIVHPQSIVHALVEFRDGSVIAQLGAPDMRVPIQYALTWPERVDGPGRRLDLLATKALTFEPVDRRRFPAVELGFRAARAGGTMGAVLNAANEVAVQAFLDGKLPFLGIAETVGQVMDRHPVIASPGLEQIRQADAWAREEARRAVDS